MVLPSQGDAWQFIVSRFRISTGDRSYLLITDGPLDLTGRLSTSKVNGQADVLRQLH